MKLYIKNTPLALHLEYPVKRNTWIIEEPHTNHYKESKLILSNLQITQNWILRPKGYYILQQSDACTVWAKTHLKTLEVAQNKLMQVITEVPWFICNKKFRNKFELLLLEDYCKNMVRGHLKLYAQHSNPTLKRTLDYDPITFQKHRRNKILILDNY